MRLDTVIWSGRANTDRNKLTLSWEKRCDKPHDRLVTSHSYLFDSFRKKSWFIHQFSIDVAGKRVQPLNLSRISDRSPWIILKTIRNLRSAVLTATPVADTNAQSTNE